MISATARCKSALAGEAFANSGRFRSSATWRASNSVLVMISPFTLTSTCSRISAWNPWREGHRTEKQGGRSESLQHDNSFNISILYDLRTMEVTGPRAPRATPSGGRTCPPRLAGSMSGFRRTSSFVNPGFTSPAVARVVHQLT